MSERRYSDEEVERAIAELTEEGRLEAAQELVAQRMPELQHILAQALESGGWFTDVREAEVQKIAAPDREMALRTLLAEETRLGMFVGVAVGLELARTLDRDDQ